MDTYGLKLDVPGNNSTAMSEEEKKKQKSLLLAEFHKELGKLIAEGKQGGQEDKDLRNQYTILLLHVDCYSSPKECSKCLEWFLKRKSSFATFKCVQ